MIVAALPVAGAGSDVAVSPAGTPVNTNATLLALPPERAIKTLATPPPPCATVTLVFNALSEKSPVTVTVRLNVAIASVTPVPVAWTVTVTVPGVAAPDADRKT